MDPCIRLYMIRFDFYGLYSFRHVTFDLGLIISLVERWRPKTHTVQLLIGEMTITLQDVVIILGLRIHRPPVTGTCNLDWSSLCHELLGVIPLPFELRRSIISTQWLSQQLSTPPIKADDVTLERSAQAFILAFLESTLFAY